MAQHNDSWAIIHIASVAQWQSTRDSTDTRGRNRPAIYFDNVVTPLMGQADYAQKLQEITNIATACGGKLDKFDFTNANRLVDMLYKFSTSQWGELQALFPAISDVIGQNAAVVERMNTFLGLNMAEAPGWVPSFAWIIPVLAAVSQWFSTKLMSAGMRTR